MSTTPANDRTPGRRTIRFGSVDAVLSDVALLRRTGYRKVGQWSLPQVCHHLAIVIGGNLTPPATDAPPTPEQVATKTKFFGIVQAGMPEGMPAGATTPPETADDGAVDRLATAFADLAAYPHATLLVGRCGPVPVDEVRQLHLAHAAHHLSFLEPTTVRRTLRYGSVADVIADVEHLRKGYVRSGSWTLPQACWHLRATTVALAAAPVHEPTPEQTGRRPTLDAVLAGQPLPSNLPAPDAVLPPATAGEDDVNAFLALLTERLQRPPVVAMHRLFGPLTAAEAGRLMLSHCAHHLSYFVEDPMTAIQNRIKS